MKIFCKFKGAMICITLEEKTGLVQDVRWERKGVLGHTPDSHIDNDIINSFYDVLAKRGIDVEEKARYKALISPETLSSRIISVKDYVITHQVHHDYSFFKPGVGYGSVLKEEHQLLTEVMQHFALKHASFITFNNDQEREQFYQFFPDLVRLKRRKEEDEKKEAVIAQANKSIKSIVEELKEHKNICATICRFAYQKDSIDTMLAPDKLEHQLLKSWRFLEEAKKDISRYQSICSDQKMLEKAERRNQDLQKYLIRSSQALIPLKKLPVKACHLYINFCAEEKIWDNYIASLRGGDNDLEDPKIILASLIQFEKDMTLLFQNTPWSVLVVDAYEKNAYHHLVRYREIIQKEIENCRLMMKIPQAFLCTETRAKMTAPIVNKMGFSYEDGVLGDEKVRIVNYGLKSLMALFENKKKRMQSIFKIDYREIREIHCPVTLNVMFNPTITDTGHTFEALPLQQLSHDPETRALITKKLPNLALRQFIKEYAEKNPEALEKFIQEEWDINDRNIQQYIDWINELNISDKARYISLARQEAGLLSDPLELKYPESKYVESKHRPEAAVPAGPPDFKLLQYQLRQIQTKTLNFGGRAPITLKELDLVDFKAMNRESIQSSGVLAQLLVIQEELKPLKNALSYLDPYDLNVRRFKEVVELLSGMIEESTRQVVSLISSGQQHDFSQVSQSLERENLQSFRSLRLS